MGWTVSETGRAYAVSAAVLVWRAMGQGYPSIADLATELGISKNTADRWVTLAEKYGQVRRLRQETGSTFMWRLATNGEFAKRLKLITKGAIND